MIKPKIKTKVTDKDFRRISREVKKLNKAITAIGLFEDTPNYPDGTSVPLVGFWNEFGTKRSPERSWMRSFLDEHKKELERLVKSLFSRVLRGELDARQAISRLGAWAETGMKKQITNFVAPENALSTIKKKKSSQPLIDTGQMRGAVEHREFLKGERPK